jgi:nucleotide-binding universal stress UspA family protein
MSVLSLPKILAPVDFSERSPGAARFAGRLACQFRSELTLMHVLDPSIYALTDYEAAKPAIRKLSEAWGRRTKDLLENFLPGELGYVEVQRIVLPGNPGSEIVDFAHFNCDSLIVMPTHGFEPFRPFLLGSVASKVLHEADCPVLTGVHSRQAFPDKLLGFRNILCALDFCPQSIKALTWASQLAEEFQAQLTIAHITPSTEGGVGEYFNPHRRLNWATEARQNEFAAGARQKIAEIQKMAGTTAAVVIDSSIDVPRAVCFAASQIEADLVVVGRGSFVGVDRLRTKVYSIVRQSPCPVVSV